MARVTIELLERSQSSIQQLGFRAEDRDRSLDAFQTFRKAVIRVIRGTQRYERCLLENLEPKRQYLEFLLDLSKRIPMQRSRVAEVLRCLCDVSSWLESAQADPAIWIAIQGFISECESNSDSNKSTFGHARRASEAAASVEVSVDKQRVIAKRELQGASQTVVKQPVDPWSSRSKPKPLDIGAESTTSGQLEQTQLTPQFGTPQKKVWSPPRDLWAPVSTKSPTSGIAATESGTAATESGGSDPKPSLNPFKSKLPAPAKKEASSNPFKTLLTSNQPLMSGQQRPDVAKSCANCPSRARG